MKKKKNKKINKISNVSTHHSSIKEAIDLRGPRWLNELGRWRAQVAQWVRSLDYLTTHTSLSPIRCGFAFGFVNYKKGCTRLVAASDKVYQLLDHDRWLSPGTPASSTTKTGRHDIAEILLKVALNTINQSISLKMPYFWKITDLAEILLKVMLNTKKKFKIKSIIDITLDFISRKLFL